MDHRVKEKISASTSGFKLPRYNMLPDVGLYLEQTSKYIADCLEPIAHNVITGSMISNYVKRGLIASPVKKQYSREQIAYLIYISVVKSVLPMEDIRLMIAIQTRTYSGERAYDYFCSELENVLDYVFGRKMALETVGVDSTDEKVMLRNTIITVAHKVYLDKLFSALREQEMEQAQRGDKDA